MDNNVLMFPGTETIEVGEAMGPRLEVAGILERAHEHDLQDVVVLGSTKDGSTYFASSSGDPRDILWDLEKGKYILMNSYFSGAFSIPSDFEGEE